MLLELPPTVALVGSIIGLLLFLGLSYLASFMSRHFKRIKPKAEEDSRCSTYHVGLLVTGSIMLCIGLYDAWNMQQSFIARNRLIDAPIISVALGLLSISCGSSAIFSTNENKTSIDSKILSISWLWLVAFAVWDRARPPLFNLWAMFVLTGASSATIMIFPDSNGLINIAVTLGYMICCLALELSFGYGPVASEQLQLGHIALYLGGLGTSLLNFSLDTNSSTTKHIGLAIMCCWTVWFGYLLSSIVFLLVAFSALSAIFKFPQFSCQVGSWASTLGIFVWWIMLRLRPGNPPMSVFDGYEFFAVALLIVYKLNIRRLLAVRSLENIVLGIWVENVSIFVEKAAFCLWGYYLLFVYPAKENNFFFDTFLCWSHPAMPSFSLNLYYLVNMASCIEDVVWWITSGASTPRYFSSMTPSDYRNGRDRDAFDNKLIGLYHILTSMFLIGSYYSGKFCMFS